MTKSLVTQIDMGELGMQDACVLYERNGTHRPFISGILIDFCRCVIDISDNLSEDALSEVYADIYRNNEQRMEIDWTWHTT